LSRVAGAIGKIIAHPIKFLSTMVDGVKAGLDAFTGKIGEHLEKGLTSWLFGELGSSGIELPEAFDLKGIFNLVASILGLSRANFRARLERKLSPEVLARVEKQLGYVTLIASGGLLAVWDLIADKISGLADIVMDKIRGFVIERILV